LVVKVPTHRIWNLLFLPIDLTWLWGTFVTGLLLVGSLILLRWIHRAAESVDLPPTLSPGSPRPRPAAAPAASASHSI
jgi:hypothetical protein